MAEVGDTCPPDDRTPERRVFAGFSQRVADLLERDGLAAYEANPRHRRAKLARLTPAGRKVLRRIQRAQREWADRHGAEVGVADLEQAAQLLRRARAILTRANRQRPHETAEDAGGAAVTSGLSV
jgi:DNA-binding PadR family transcriptional regulator